MKYDYLIVGAGPFGATFAYLATKAGKRCLVIDKRNHIKVSEMAEYPENGKVVYLKEYGNVRVFRQLFKEAYRYYIMCRSLTKTRLEHKIYDILSY